MVYIMLDQKFDSKKFSGFCYENGLTLLGSFEADPDKGQAAQVIYEDMITKVKCYYVEDYLIDLRYLILEGKKEKELFEKLNQAKSLRTISQDKIANTAKKHKNKQELVLALRMLAVISPVKYDEDFFDLFNIGLAHQDPAVRHASLQIVTYPSWEEFYIQAKEMAKADPSEEVRLTAGNFVREYERLHKKSK